MNVNHHPEKRLTDNNWKMDIKSQGFGSAKHKIITKKQITARVPETRRAIGDL